MAWGVLEEEMDKLDFVLLSSVKMVTRLMLRVWGSEYNQKMALQIEVKSCWYSGLEEPEASQLLKGKGLNLQGEGDWKDQHGK